MTRSEVSWERSSEHLRWTWKHKMHSFPNLLSMDDEFEMHRLVLIGVTKFDWTMLAYTTHGRTVSTSVYLLICSREARTLDFSIRKNKIRWTFSVQVVLHVSANTGVQHDYSKQDFGPEFFVHWVSTSFLRLKEGIGSHYNHTEHLQWYALEWSSAKLQSHPALAHMKVVIDRSMLQSIGRYKKNARAVTF